LTVVLYPGSFDPVHNGHLEIVEIAAKLFDRVIVAAMRNPQKGEPLFSLASRVTPKPVIRRGFVSLTSRRRQQR